MSTIAKITASSLGAMAILFATTAQAQTNVLSDPVGFYKIPIAAGANFISAPLFKVQTYRGNVSGVAGNVITLSGVPGFTNNAFAPASVGSVSFTQYILVVRNDADKTVGASNNITGDWWKITANGTNSVTLDPAQGSPSLIATGDQVEVRQLTSFKDLFGSGTSFILNKDADGSPDSSQEDLIKYVSGTSFSREVFYHNGNAAPEGYYVDGDQGPDDGSRITIEPDEPLMVFRKTGSPATNVVVLGQVQTLPLTHYLSSGANTVANVFPANAPLGTSNLKESGFLMDSDGSPDTTQEDVLKLVVGTSFQTEIFLHDGSQTASPPVWIHDGDQLDNNFPLVPGVGYIYFVKAGTGGRIWRQSVPFTP